MSMLRKRNKKGYLLLEVVASIAVVAIGLGVILRAFTSSLRASKIAQEYFEASLALQEKLCELEEGEKLSNGVSPDETSAQISGTPFTLDTKVSRIGDSDPLNEVVVRIYWEKRGRSENMAVGTYLKNK